MIKCPKCGAKMPNSSNFCTECGAKLTNKTSSVTNQTKTSVSNVSDEIRSQEQNNMHSNINFQRIKKMTVNYWKWLVNSWIYPTDTKIPSSKWFGMVSIISEIFLLVASYFVLARRAINATNSIAQSVANSLGINSGSITISPFNSSFKIFFVLVLLGAAVLSAIYGINCWLFREKEDFLSFINRFAHYTNMILILNLLIFFFCLVSNAFSFISLLFMISIFFYLLGTSAVILVRNDAVRFDKIYGVVFTAIIMIIATILLFKICGTMIGEILQSNLIG